MGSVAMPDLTPDEQSPRLVHRLAPWAFAALVALALWAPRLDLLRTRTAQQSRNGVTAR